MNKFAIALAVAFACFGMTGCGNHQLAVDDNPIIEEIQVRAAEVQEVVVKGIEFA